MSQLFESAAIGGMELRNRFVRSATAMGMTDGTAVGDELKGAYKELASGGVGLICTGYSYVSKKGQSIERMIALDETADLAALRSLTDTVHQEGAKIMAQLVHGGANRMFDPGFPAEAPSVVQHGMSQTIPLAMTEEDIDQAVQDFASAAKRAVECGFDAVQIHAAHEYLISEFLSPFSNMRSDQYGGSIENRARILFEIYQAVRSAAGSALPITVKIHAKDYQEDGLTVPDASWVCRELSAMGVDAIELHAFGGPEFMGLFSNIDEPGKEAYLEAYAKEIKPQLDCPLILVGGLRSLDVIGRLYNEQAADFFSLSRPLISQPDLINGWQSGESRSSRCVSCNKCLFTLLQGGSVKCYHFDGEG